MQYCVTIERTQWKKVWFKAVNEETACRVAGKIMGGFNSSSEFEDEEWNCCISDKDGRTIEPRKWAEHVATDFLVHRNPSLWNGKGVRPADFDEMCCTYDFGNPYYLLDIYFEYDEDEQAWGHVCEVVDKEAGQDGMVGMAEGMHGHGVDSAFNIADTILDICTSFGGVMGEPIDVGTIH